MSVYIILFCVLLGLGLVTHFFSERKWLVKLYCVIAWLLMTIIAALRWGNGIDFNYYHNDFFVIGNAAGWNEVFQMGHEFGYLILARVVSLFTENIIVYMFIFHGLMYGLLMLYVYKYAEVKWSAVITFLAFDYFAMSFCFMRQGMAMVIGLFAFEMIKQRKSYWAVLLTILAASFHVSAIMLLLCLFISYIDIDRHRIFRLYVVFVVIISLGFDFILNNLLIGPFEKYATYLDSPFMEGNSILIVYYPIVVFVLMLCFFKDLCNTDKTFKIMVPILFMGTVMSIMTTQHYLVERMALYITIYNIRLVPQILAVIKEKRSKEYLNMAVYGVVVFCACAYIFALMIDRYGITPYVLNQTYLNDVSFFGL